MMADHSPEDCVLHPNWSLPMVQLRKPVRRTPTQLSAVASFQGSMFTTYKVRYPWCVRRVVRRTTNYYVIIVNIQEGEWQPNHLYLILDPSHGLQLGSQH